MTKTENLPAELRETGLFCCWRYEEQNGRMTKVPYNPRTGGGAQSNNSTTFAPMDAALSASAEYDGLGVGVFGSLGAIDIDHCIDDEGSFSELAASIMSTMNSYTECSPSGRGVRILFKATGFQYDKPRYYIMNKSLGLEVYIAGCTNKFVTCTGNVIADCGYEERGEQLQEVLDRFMVRPERKTEPALPAGTVTLEDTALIEKAQQSKGGASFSALWAGDITGYGSHSEADIALCNALAWWTNRDADRMDKLFRQSGLMREKWDRPQSGSTYGAITIQKAVDGCSGGYDLEEYRARERAQAFSPQVTENSISAIFAIFEPFSPPDTSKLPAFPVEALPPVLRDMAAATAENLQVAVDMPALAELTVAALCLQGKFIINPKPGWLEPLNLYSVIVALPSDRKSPTMKVITRHVYEFVKEENVRLRPLVDEYNMKRAILTKQIAGMVEKAAKPEGKTGKAVDPKDIVELQYQLADLENEEVRPLRLLADDITPEALTSLMAENGGKMAVVSSEGGIFDIAAGRYSEKLNMDVFLKAYSGDYIQIDRKGRPSESIEHPALTMLLTVQPAVLEAIMGNTDFAGRGFLARFLYSLPVSTVGHRRYETPAIPFQTELAYEQLLDSLLSIKDLGQARIIKLSPEAHNEARRFSEALEPRLRDDLEEVEAWAGKYHGQVMRIAGILHCCIHGDNAANEPVCLNTMLNAQTIGMYFLDHAQAAFQIMGLSDDPATKEAKYILKRLVACGQMEMSKRDLFQLCNGRFRRVEDLEVGMKVLVDRGYMAVETVKTGKQGRPTENIKVNPELQKLQ